MRDFLSDYWDAILAIFGAATMASSIVDYIVKFLNIDHAMLFFIGTGFFMFFGILSIFRSKHEKNVYIKSIKNSKPRIVVDGNASENPYVVDITVTRPVNPK